MKKAVYFFCMDETIDPVASKVFAQLCGPLTETGVVVDGLPVLERADGMFRFVRTRNVLSHDYDTYLPIMNEHFADCDIAGVVNWHEGANAPDRVLTVHSTGDVASGCFAAAAPVYLRSLLRAMERSRAAHGLDDFRVVTEATHWSGIPYGQPPERITAYPVPVVDIEIGSTPESWGNAEAAEVVAEALLGVFDDNDAPPAIVCIGGVHFEDVFGAVMLGDVPVAVGHILANQWVVGQYQNGDGVRKLEACLDSVRGGVAGIVFHDNLKGEYKQLCRDVAESRGIFAVKHKSLRDLAQLTELLR